MHWTIWSRGFEHGDYIDEFAFSVEVFVKETNLKKKENGVQTLSLY